MRLNVYMLALAWTVKEQAITKLYSQWIIMLGLSEHYSHSKHLTNISNNRYAFAQRALSCMRSFEENPTNSIVYESCRARLVTMQ